MRGRFRVFLREVPLLGQALKAFVRGWRARQFVSSKDYWSKRYRRGDTSGAGSYGALARFKAATLNKIVREFECQTVIELGCGDGEQLRLADYPSYVGVDVAPEAVNICRSKFAADTSKVFWGLDDLQDCGRHFDISLSIDVIFHLVEDDVFDYYMRKLCSLSRDLVVIYSSNYYGSCPNRS